MKRSILLLLLAFCSVYVFSQDFEFGEVSKSELEEKQYPSDPSAHAAVLFKNQNTFFQSANGNLSVITEVHERIKIYDKEGFDYATQSIRLYRSGSEKENLYKIKAQTYNLENGKVVSSKMEKDQIFNTRLSENYDQTKFTLPDVKVGSVIEYQYRITSPFVWNLDEFKFQYDIPIKQIRAEIRTPKGVKFKQMFKGYIPINSKRSEKTDHRLGMQVEVDEFSLTNVPALKSESYIDNINNYSAGILFELVSIRLGTYFKSYSQTWDDVARTLGNSNDYEKELSKTNAFDDEIDALLVGSSDPREKMRKIYRYLKENVEWNGMDGKYFYNGFKNSLKEKKGNTADMNLLLVAMLRYANITANPVVISTKDNLVPYFPTIDRLNSVIAYAVIGNDKYYMDASEEFSDINILPERDYNWQGLLIDNENMKWGLIEIDPPTKTQSRTMVQARLNENGELEGSCSSRYTNHSALRFRANYKDSDMDVYLSNMEKDMDNLEISNYEAGNTDTYEGHVSQKFDFFYENASELVSDKIYLNPLSFLRLESNPFSQETRTYPIDFGYPFEDIYTVSIMLPEGYKVESAPESVVMKLPDGMGEYKFLIKHTPNSIQLSSSSEINSSRIGVEKYDFIKTYFSQMITKQSEQVILSKS